MKKTKRKSATPEQARLWVKQAIAGASALAIAKKARVTRSRVAGALDRAGLVNKGTRAIPKWVPKAEKKHSGAATTSK